MNNNLLLDTVIKSFKTDIDALNEAQSSVDDLITKSSKIKSLIDELIQFKQTLKRGPNRLKYRKEATNLQRAIETLRYLDRVNNKLIDELNAKESL
jgi:hypothetical protein